MIVPLSFCASIVERCHDDPLDAPLSAVSFDLAYLICFSVLMMTLATVLFKRSL
jgi:hypothetical protein